MPENVKFKPCRRPAGGYVWNPLKNYERNKPCFCGSGIKAKKCCLHKIIETIPTEVMEKIKGRSAYEQYQIILEYYVRLSDYLKRKENDAKKSESDNQ